MHIKYLLTAKPLAHSEAAALVCFDNQVSTDMNSLNIMIIPIIIKQLASVIENLYKPDPEWLGL